MAGCESVVCYVRVVNHMRSAPGVRGDSAQWQWTTEVEYGRHDRVGALTYGQPFSRNGKRWRRARRTHLLQGQPMVLPHPHLHSLASLLALRLRQPPACSIVTSW
jgi:hypothetical protein